MKKVLFSVLVTTISVSSFAMDKSNINEYKDQKLKGNFSYLVRGGFNGALGSGKLTETGVFSADGKGNVTAEAIVNIATNDIATSLPSGPVSYKCTYENAENFFKSGMTLLHCIRHQANFEPQDQNLDLVLSQVKNSPTVQIEALSGGSFGTVQVSGQGSRSED